MLLRFFTASRGGHESFKVLTLGYARLLRNTKQIGDLPSRTDSEGKKYTNWAELDFQKSCTSKIKFELHLAIIVLYVDHAGSQPLLDKPPMAYGTFRYVLRVLIVILGVILV